MGSQSRTRLSTHVHAHTRTREHTHTHTHTHTLTHSLSPYRNIAQHTPNQLPTMCCPFQLLQLALICFTLPPCTHCISGTLECQVHNFSLLCTLYSFICVGLASSHPSAACSRPRGWLCVFGFSFTDSVPYLLTFSFYCNHMLFFSSSFRASVSPGWGSRSYQNNIHRNLSL